MSVSAGSVVVGVDGSVGADRAAAWGARVALREDRPLVLVHAVPRTSAWMLPPIDIATLDDELAAAGSQVLADAAARLRDVVGGLGTAQVVTVVARAEAEELLVDLSGDAHLLVVGSRGRGRVGSAVLGSVSSSVVRRTACPLVVVPDAAGPAGRGVVVGVDGTEESLPAADLAFRAASWLDEPLTVVHCFWEPERSTGHALAAPPRSDLTAERALVAETVAGLQERYPDVEAHVELDRGLPEDVLTDLSHDASLVVVGMHEHGAFTELVVGSVTTAVVQHGHCPVAVVPRLS